MQQVTRNVEQNHCVVIETKAQQWVIPHNCELLKALIHQQKINASDLEFRSSFECKHFIKNLFLLALEDETKNHSPSMLAEFGRDLIKLQRDWH